MSAKEVTAVAIKLLGIWLLVHVILYVPSLTMMINSFQDYNQEELPNILYFTLGGTSLLIGLIASFLLFRISNSVLNSMPSKISENSDSGVISQQFILQLGGVFFIVSALGSMPGMLFSMGKTTAVQASSYFYIGGRLFELAAGLYLLIKPKVWVHFFSKLRGRA